MVMKSILIIDHDASVREVIHICLRELAGWQVWSTSSLQAGLSSLSNKRPDALLVDFSTPKMDGLDFIRTLKRSPLTRSIPIVLITIKASWFTPQELKNMGVAGAIAKPFDPISLPGQVAQLLGWHDTDQAVSESFEIRRSTT